MNYHCNSTVVLVVISLTFLFPPETGKWNSRRQSASLVYRNSFSSHTISSGAFDVHTLMLRLTFSLTGFGTVVLRKASLPCCFISIVSFFFALVLESSDLKCIEMSFHDEHLYPIYG